MDLSSIKRTPGNHQLPVEHLVSEKILKGFLELRSSVEFLVVLHRNAILLPNTLHYGEGTGHFDSQESFEVLDVGSFEVG